MPVAPKVPMFSLEAVCVPDYNPKDPNVQDDQVPHEPSPEVRVASHFTPDSNAPLVDVLHVLDKLSLPRRPCPVMEE